MHESILLIKLLAMSYQPYHTSTAINPYF